VFIPALLTGNAVLYKPSEFSTLTGLAIADLFHTAGVPQEIFVPIIGAGPVGATLLEQPLDSVFFTGSYRTGKKIATAAAAQLAKVQLELGGKDPAYVCDDGPDVAAVAAAVANGAFYNNGQSCCSVERIYVHAAIYDEFLAAFLETVQGFVMGDETFGPMIGIQKVSSDAEAMELMNDTVYGLTAAVYSPNRQRALEILSQVSSGSAY
jgi:acyl-CoA reductase-like NAD-dependent aldehyde dehydrogenase